jgi:hypothetical protein
MTLSEWNHDALPSIGINRWILQASGKGIKVQDTSGSWPDAVIRGNNSDQSQLFAGMPLTEGF